MTAFMNLEEWGNLYEYYLKYGNKKEKMMIIKNFKH